VLHLIANLDYKIKMVLTLRSVLIFLKDKFSEKVD